MQRPESRGPGGLCPSSPGLVDAEPVPRTADVRPLFLGPKVFLLLLVEGS